jgi:hypothetical protein
MMVCSLPAARFHRPVRKTGEITYFPARLHPPEPARLITMSGVPDLRVLALVVPGSMNLLSQDEWVIQPSRSTVTTVNPPSLEELMRTILKTLGIVGLALMSGQPVCTSCSYVYSHSNSRVAWISGQPVCADTGRTCIESGFCDGSAYCVDDGVDRDCRHRDQMY